MICCISLGVFNGSLYTNSNWFAFEDDRVTNERSIGSLVSPSPNTEVTVVINGVSDDNVIDGEDDDLVDTATSSPEAGTKSEDTTILITQEKWDMLKLINHLNGLNGGKTTDSGDPSDVLPDNEIQVELELSAADATEASSSTGGLERNDETVAGHLPKSIDEDPSSDPSENLIIVPYETMALPNKILDFSPVKGRL